MARFAAFLMVLLSSHFCMAQKMELKELTSLLDVPVNKLDNVLQKKGFRKDPFLTASESASMSFVRNNKENSFTQFLWLNPDNAYVYETTVASEFADLCNEIRSAGFYSPKNDSSNKQSLVYQKQVFTIETDSRTADSTQYFVLKLSRKDLPKRRDIVFAEDLLQLDSYEYLSEMFGKDQVKNDYFFYAEDDSSRCSIIFPNTSREAIIIWKDEEHLRNINFILIGGSLRSANTAATVQAFNGWRSK
ncbi:MAG: hypothetical protein EOO02_22915, partial [Chitinophagaceae bacterium]